jgi:hypothetical protein
MRFRPLQARVTKAQVLEQQLTGVIPRGQVVAWQSVAKFGPAELCSEMPRPDGPGAIAPSY